MILILKKGSRLILLNKSNPTKCIDYAWLAVILLLLVDILGKICLKITAVYVIFESLTSISLG